MSSVETLIVEIRKTVEGELTSRTLVVDALLDLRLTGVGYGAVVATVDGLLADMPGQTTVPNSWWLAALADIERVVRPPVSAQAGSAQTSSAASVPGRERPPTTPPPLPRRRPPR